MTSHHDTRERLTHVIDRWLTMWNGHHELVAELIAPEFDIWFGNFPGAGAGVRNPATFAAFLATYRAANVDAHFVPGEIVVDEIAGRGALVWTVTATLPGEERPRELGGVDQFTFERGRVRRVWSMGGAEARPF